LARKPAEDKLRTHVAPQLPSQQNKTTIVIKSTTKKNVQKEPQDVNFWSRTIVVSPSRSRVHSCADSPRFAQICGHISYTASSEQASRVSRLAARHSHLLRRLSMDPISVGLAGLRMTGQQLVGLAGLRITGPFTCITGPFTCCHALTFIRRRRQTAGGCRRCTG